MFYYLFIIIFLIVFLFLIGYLLFRLNKLSIFKIIKNNKISKITLIIIFILSTIFMIIDSINTLIVLIHLFIFLIIYDSIIGIIKFISKKNINNSISYILTIVTALIYFIYGYYSCHNIVRTNYIIKTNKNIGTDNFRIVQVTDSHIGATINGDEFIKYMKEINKLNPDIVVITGDFVDDDTTREDMVKSSKGLGMLKTKYGVYFIYGNHDKAYFNYRNFNNKQLRKELKKNNVIILEDEVKLINNYIYLVGRQDRLASDRLEAETLTDDLDKNKYIIGLDHRPDDYGNEVNANFDLVLSGHTHGGQMWPIGQLSVLLGINDSYYGKKVIDDTTFITSSGISDWAIKFKTGTISEYVVIDIKNKLK